MEYYTINSEELTQNLTVVMEKNLCVILCDDGVEYTQFEVKILESGNISITKSVHNIKKIFDGRIVSVKKQKNKEVTYGKQRNFNF